MLFSTGYGKATIYKSERVFKGFVILIPYQKFIEALTNALGYIP